MHKHILALSVLLLAPRIVLADAASAPDVASGEPCKEAENLRFRSMIFAKADAPLSLLNLVSHAVCPIYSESPSTAVRQHLPRRVRYIDKYYDADGTIIREDRSLPIREAASIITASTVSTYAELSIVERRNATLEITNFVCSMTVQASLEGDKWVVGELMTLCE